jgi:mannose-1-phosphate guanylyltransferase
MTHASEVAGHQLWAIVLAGGQGVRLRPLMRRLYGEDRPKQFAALLGSRSLLRETLDRVRRLTVPERTVIVTHRNHEPYLANALDGAPVRRVLAQPEDRGTAAGVMLPTHWIHRADPDAIVAVFPSDHFIPDEQAFVDHMAEVVDVVREHPEWIVLVGATPTDPDPDYGWVEPGELLDSTPSGRPVNRVVRFWEKPSRLTAGACLEKGWLWNTFVFVARASVLMDVSSHLLPRLHERLSFVRSFAGTDLEARAVSEAYALVDKASFSRSVLESCPSSLVVSRMPRMLWSDWGTPERVVRSLRAAGLLPAWFDLGELSTTPAA